MKLKVGLAAICAALATAGVAAGAHAAQPVVSAAPATAATAAAAAFGDTGAVNNSLHFAAPRKSLQWDTKGRWGLKLDYQSPGVHDTQWQSVDAGGFYKLTPRLQFGATVGLADQPDPRVITPEQQTPQPRVRLETTFKF
jgi:hypothetical protein